MREEEPAKGTVPYVLYEGVTFADLIVYSIMLCFALFMVVKYVILDKKYTAIYLTTFYVLTIIVSISNISLLVCSIRWSGASY